MASINKPTFTHDTLLHSHPFSSSDENSPAHTYSTINLEVDEFAESPLIIAANEVIQPNRRFQEDPPVSDLWHHFLSMPVDGDREILDRAWQTYDELKSKLVPPEETSTEFPHSLSTPLEPAENSPSKITI